MPETRRRNNHDPTVRTITRSEELVQYFQYMTPYLALRNSVGSAILFWSLVLLFLAIAGRISFISGGLSLIVIFAAMLFANIFRDSIVPKDAASKGFFKEVASGRFCL